MSNILQQFLDYLPILLTSALTLAGGIVLTNLKAWIKSFIDNFTKTVDEKTKLKTEKLESLVFKLNNEIQSLKESNARLTEAILKKEVKDEKLQKN